MKKVTLLLLSIAFSFAVSAQESNSGDDSNQDQTEEKEEKSKPNREFRSWSIGADIGLNLLIGDFYSWEANKESYYDDFGGFFSDPGFSFNIQHWYSSAWGWRGRWSYATYSGTDGIYASETNGGWRGDLAFQLNLSGIGKRNITRERKNAFIANFGIGWASTNTFIWKDGQEYFKLGSDSEPTFGGDDVEREEARHNYIYVPFGIEYRRKLTNRWELTAAVDFLWALDDNMDGSATTTKNDFGKDPTNQDVIDLAFRNTTNDFLLYGNIGVNYNFQFGGSDNETPIIYVGPGTDPRVDTLVDQMGQIMEDADNDGVSDYFDKEPDTPEGYMVYGGGQAVDQDKDGIPDDADEDPFSTPGEKVDANGRELDDDGDGVPNGKDLEPSTKPGSFVNYQGVTIVDKVGGGGAGEAFLPNVYFDFNKSNITSANYQRLVTVARFMEANPDVKLRVVGHTDKVGTEAYNQGLSDRRAEAAKKALVNDFGVDESRLDTEGKGKTMLMSKRDDINRRVEFQIVK